MFLKNSINPESLSFSLREGQLYIFDQEGLNAEREHQNAENITSARDGIEKSLKIWKGGNKSLAGT